MPSKAPLSFIDIENQLAALPAGTWEKKAKGIVKRVRELIREGDYGAASEYVLEENLDYVLDDHRKKVELYLTSALILGAKQVAGNSSKISFVESGVLPPVVDLAQQAYEKIITQAGNEQFTKHTLALINEMKDKGLREFDDSITKAEDIETVAQLSAALNDAVIGSGKKIIDISANLTTSRLVSYGFLAEAKMLGVTEYKLSAVLDDRTSKICRALDGKTFKVEQAFTMIDQALRVTDPNDLKAIHPWVPSTKDSIAQLKDLSPGELAAKGVMVPPFHPNCRTTLVMVGKDIESVEVKNPMDGGTISMGFDRTPSSSPSTENSSTMSIFGFNVDTAFFDKINALLGLDKK